MSISKNRETEVKQIYLTEEQASQILVLLSLAQVIETKLYEAVELPNCPSPVKQQAKLYFTAINKSPKIKYLLECIISIAEFGRVQTDISDCIYRNDGVSKYSCFTEIYVFCKSFIRLLKSLNKTFEFYFSDLIVKLEILGKLLENLTEEKDIDKMVIFMAELKTSFENNSTTV